MSAKSLNNDQITLLSKTLKFVPTPKSPDLLDLEIDIKQFIRKLKLREHFYYFTSQKDENIVSLPSDWAPYKFRNQTLSNFCDSLKNKSEALSQIVPTNVKSNISPGEQKALRDLMADEDIIIKPADKGNVVVILDKLYYKNAMVEALSNSNVYVEQPKNNDHKNLSAIKHLAVEYSYAIKPKERMFISNFNYSTSNIYGLPKIHKSGMVKEAIKNANNSYIHIPTPDDLKFRKIAGGVNTPTSHLSIMLDKMLKPLLTKIPSYIKDYTDFLNKLNRFSKTELSDILLVSVDIVDMYNSIKIDLGLEAITYFCNLYPEEVIGFDRFDCNFITKGLTLVLKNNLCHFDGKYYTQISGTFTGTTVAPTYATLTLAFLEIKLLEKLKQNYSLEVANYIWCNWHRYLDDGFIAWKKSFGEIDLFIQLLNSLHPDINFTHEYHEQRLPYLNILVYKGSEKLMTDIYFKETDTKEYLPFNSCHEHHTKINIPYTLSRMICTIVEDRDICRDRLIELKSNLIKCGYPLDVINNATHKAWNTDQEDLRTYNQKENKDTLVFVSTFNPRNPNVSKFIDNTMENIKTDPILKNIFDNCIVIKSKREPKSLKDLLVKSFFSMQKPVFGVSPCHKSRCKTCNNILPTDSYYFNEAAYIFNIRQVFDCTATDLIYVITCKNNCGFNYIGKTVNLRHRMTQHRLSINNSDLQAQKLYKHLAQCGQGDFWVTPFYKMKRPGLVAHLTTEEYFIKKFRPTLNTMGANFYS